MPTWLKQLAIFSITFFFYELLCVDKLVSQSSASRWRDCILVLKSLVECNVEFHGTNFGDNFETKIEVAVPVRLQKRWRGCLFIFLPSLDFLLTSWTHSNRACIKSACKRLTSSGVWWNTRAFLTNRCIREKDKEMCESENVKKSICFSTCAYINIYFYFLLNMWPDSMYNILKFVYLRTLM